MAYGGRAPLFREIIEPRFTPMGALTAILDDKINGLDSTLLFDYSAFEKGEAENGDIELQPGDVVLVPQKGFFE